MVQPSRLVLSTQNYNRKLSVSFQSRWGDGQAENDKTGWKMPTDIMPVRFSLVAGNSASSISQIRTTGITGHQEQLYLQASGKLACCEKMGKRCRIPGSFRNCWGDSVSLRLPLLILFTYSFSTIQIPTCTWWLLTDNVLWMHQEIWVLSSFSFFSLIPRVQSGGVPCLIKSPYLYGAKFLF